MVSAHGAIIASWLLATAFAILPERFQAVETGALLTPQLYPPVAARSLQKRQGSLQCRSGEHRCDEIGLIGENSCCPDDTYCQVDPRDTSKAACCRIGSGSCSSPCNEQQYQCDDVDTITSGTTTTVTTRKQCCPRACTIESQFQCPSSLGAGCCGHGSQCQTGGQCVSTLTSSSSISTLVPMNPEGCSTSQISCPASMGGGCCDNTRSCTFSDNRGYCAMVTITPTASGVVQVSGSTGMGSGAKAGIAVGVVVGCGLVIGALTWWCLRKRRERRQSVVASVSRNPRPTNVVGATIGGGRGREMSDVTSDVMSRSTRLDGITRDYFGPPAALGPYSETPQHPSAVTTPGLERERGVPIQPMGPGDIAAPVEIDSQARDAQSPSPYQPETPGARSRSGSEGVSPGYEAYTSIEGRFELDGGYAVPVDSPGQQQPPYVPSPYTESAYYTPAGERPQSSSDRKGQ